ncbi:uncharacterized protein [Labrus bergylta]|uniref:uncharacterized protein n=1 Tax=Labrus bergylta TaxID=56723 RepID=UPI0033134380
MEQLTVILFFSALIGVNCEELSPVKTEEHSLEDSTVTLSYSYSKQADGNDYFFWYRQYPGKQPEFIMFISGLNITKTAESLKSEKRFLTRLSEKKDRVDLQISSAALTDSAVYYCAVSYEELTPVKNDEFSLEGITVTLSYSYPELSTNDYFFWYRQHPGKQPQFIASQTSTGPLSISVSGLSVSMRQEEKQLDLQISSAALTDSAVYYCAVRPTELRTPKTGVRTEGGEITAASWKWYSLMDELHGATSSPRWP